MTVTNIQGKIHTEEHNDKFSITFTLGFFVETPLYQPKKILK